MGQNEERYVMVPNPLKPGQTVRAKVLNYEKIRGEDHEYRLEDGSRIRLVMEVDTISRPIDPETNRPLTNPTTGEPVININWGVRVIPMYSSHALEGSTGGNAK